MAAPEELAGLLALARLERPGQHSCTPRWRSYGFCLMFSLGWLETAVAHRRAAGLPRRSRHANVEKDHPSADVVAAVGAGPCGFHAGGDHRAALFGLHLAPGRAAA